MSRVDSPVMVGNDFVRSTPKPLIRKQYSTRSRYPQTLMGEVREAGQKELSRLPNLFGRILEATANFEVSPNLSPSSTSSAIMTSNYDFAQNSYSRKLLHINKAVIISLIGIIFMVLLSTTSLVYKQQIVNAVREVKTALAQKSVPAKLNPRQIIIYNSDYNQALSALITQQITVNVANTSQTVNANTIANWLSIKSKGSLTYISVRSNQVYSYLNQIADRTGNVNAGQVNAASNQVSNNLLKAKGLAINL